MSALRSDKQKIGRGPSSGFVFGPYRVLSHLASGGMADVWLVEPVAIAPSSASSATPTRLVLKTMRPEMASSVELSAMFVEEALVAAKLRHDNVVKVLDVGSIDGCHYIAMEYVRGATLRQIAKRYHEQQKRMDAWFLLRVLIGACAALEYVHGFVDEEGWPLTLVHGDVSPENIMVSFSGSVKLVDFGIARASRSARTANSGAAAIVVGKPWYMAPERVSGAVDARSDLYSLGIILYEYLSGYRPYSGETEAEVMAQVLEGRPAPLEECVAGISKSLTATTLRAMARDPEVRFPSAAHLAAELGARLREIDKAAVGRPLDAHVAQLFGDRGVSVPSSVRKRKDSELPTAPSDPSVVAAALALAEPAAAGEINNGRTRSGLIPAYRATTTAAPVLPAPAPLTPSRPIAAAPIPDIFTRSAPPHRQTADVFGKVGRVPSRMMGTSVSFATTTLRTDDESNSSERLPLLTDGERQAARLFEEGLAAASIGDLERAREAWQSAVELAPNDRRYKANLRRLEERIGK